MGFFAALRIIMSLVRDTTKDENSIFIAMTEGEVGRMKRESC